MKNKFLILLAVFLTSLLLTACTQGTDPVISPPTDAAAAETETQERPDAEIDGIPFEALV